MRLRVWLALGVILTRAGAQTVATPVTAQSNPRPAAAKAAPAAPRLTDIQRAVEEFKLQTQNLGLRPDSPLSARNKSAQPRFHGRLFENFRNDFLDATPHELRQRNSDKNLLRRNQFGFNLAGPVIIPGIYNRGRQTFFSVSYEGVRERISRSYLRTIATAPERAGDFSSTVDSNGEPLPIFDPTSTRLNPAYDPAQPVTSENLQYLRDPFPGNTIPTSRLDPVSQAAVALLPQPNTDAGPFFRNNYFAVNPETNQANGMIVKLDHTINDKNRLDFSTSFSNGFAGTARLFTNAADPNPADRAFASRRGSIQHAYTASPRALYTLELEASSTTSASQGDVFPAYRFGNSYAPLGRPNPNVRSARNNFEFSNSLALRAGNHSLRLSGRASHQQLNIIAPTYPAGMFRFGAGYTSLPGIVNTGHSFANFLLGASDYAEASVVLSPSYFRRNRYNAIVRDSWEMRKGLTLDISLNLATVTPRIEKYDRQSTIDLNVLNPANGRPGALVFANRDGYGRGFERLQVRLEPSIGLAWSPAGATKTVVRLSYGRSYEAAGLSGQTNTQGFNSLPTYISPNAQLAPAVTLRTGLPWSSFQPDLRSDAVNGIVAEIMNRSTRMPRYQSVNFSVERQLVSSVTLSAGFYHADGKNLYLGNGSANLNAISPEALVYRDRLNEESFRASLRPYPQFTSLDVNGYWPLGRYQRDSGFIRVEKRTSAGLGLNAYYEFSKQMDDYSGPYGVQDFFRRENEWSLTAGSIPKRFTLSYVYELPIGASKGLLAFSDWRKFLVDGWSLSGMTTVNSGEPLALHPQFNNTGGVLQVVNVDVVPGVDPSVPERGPEMWFNPAAFVQPADFTMGNASRTHPYLRAPISQNHDLSVNKRFALDADRTVELSAVGFNFVNHANWNDPDTLIGPASAPNANAGRIIGSTGGRVLQLGLRYSF
jgi:hypothetical protein